MQSRLAFLTSANGRFIVIVDGPSVWNGGANETLYTFADENVFIEKVIFSDLCEDVAATLISHVLLVASHRQPPNHWLTLQLSRHQLSSLGLYARSELDEHPDTSSLQLLDNLDLQSVLRQAPLAVATLTGPKHRISFINLAYANALGRQNVDALLGREVREALPELEGQPCFESLDKVYRTGQPHIGVGVKIKIRHSDSGTIEETYFDFFYYPLRDRSHNVTGVMCLARDVRESVLARQVTDSRESQLFRQWAELEAIYQHAPVGMCLLDAKETRIIRINEQHAELMGQPAHKLVGKNIFDVFPGGSLLRERFGRVAAGEAIKNVEMATELPNGLSRKWLLSFTPIADAFGNVETISVTAMEVSGWTELVRPFSTDKRPEEQSAQQEYEALPG